MPKLILNKKQVEEEQEVYLQEPEYVDDDEYVPVSQQKWKIPKEGLEVKILSSARPMVRHPKYATHEEKAHVQEITKGAISLQSGIISKYPEEWVEFCCDFCARCWREGRPMPLENLIKYINNQEKMVAWVSQWASKNKVTLSGQIE